MERQIQKPIFILGSGRSGTTLLYNLLSVHPDLCWFSNITDAHASFPHLAFLHRVLDIPLFGHSVIKYIIGSTSEDRILFPSEGVNIYHSYAGFVRDRKTTFRDMRIEDAEKFKYSIAIHLMATGRHRFISKQNANTQRIGILRKMFPDAYFVHIIRDGRAVAYSLSQAYWWPDIRLWWLHGQKPSEVKKYKKHPIELCAVHWSHNIQEIQSYRSILGDRYIEVRYESLIRDVHTIMSQVLKQCELKLDSRYMNVLPRVLPDMNMKWRHDLSINDQHRLTKTVRPTLSALGYT